MLNRREFLKLSSVLAAGAAISLTSFSEVIGRDPLYVPLKPILHHRGHARSGCAFRPELTDIWAGGGAELPDAIQ
jgi:hypothetical protein